jgi:hypothetical protein
MSPLGIDAASITFGSARGGHNLIQNSSFELGSFSQSVVNYYAWDVRADWDATRLYEFNMTTNDGDIQMASVT